MKLQKLFVAVLVSLLLAAGQNAKAQFSISVTVAPPALVEYQQPVCPGDGYMWIPGYWAYSPETGYYWVPGYWTLPPDPGLYWTPGYWSYYNGGYAWTAGYWGASVGYYGNINYGYGYYGSGYVGGRWDNKVFYYNSAINNIGHGFNHVYVNNNFQNNKSGFSYSGNGGANFSRKDARKSNNNGMTRYQQTGDQRMQRQAALSNTSLHYDNNNGQVSQNHIDGQRQNVQNFRQQHQNETEFKSSGHAVPMNNGRQSSQQSNRGGGQNGGGRR